MSGTSLIASLGVAFLLGMRHALDADHLAAVAVLSGRRDGLRQAVRNGLSWGAGHAMTIGLAGGTLLLLRLTVPDGVARGLEILVGLVLIGLGGAAVAAALRSRLHVHRHEHDGVAHSHLHFHATMHRGDAPHRHPHPFRPALRPFLVGGLHGLAGSGAVVVLILTTVPTVLAGSVYLGLFGLGNIVGMGLVSVALGAPLAIARRRGDRLHRAVRLAAGLASVTIGLGLVLRLLTRV